jgi:hypothetical protein
VVWVATERERSAFHGMPFVAAPLEGLREGRRLAEAPPDVDLVVVRPLGPGFLVLCTTASQRVQVFVLDEHLAVVGGPREVAQANDEVFWVESLPQDDRSVLLWATRRGDRADVFAAVVSRSGELIGEAKAVARDAKAWQVASSGEGLAIAMTKAALGHTVTGSVELLMLDAAAQPRGKPIVVSPSPTASFDIDLAIVQGHAMLAWSDVRDVEARVYLAAVAADGTVSAAPRPATERVGEQALIRLVAAPDQRSGYLLWDELWEQTSTTRSLRLAPITPEAVLGPSRLLLQVSADAGAHIEVAASRRGLSVLTAAPACPAGTPLSACQDAPPVPHYLELSPTLDLLASEPVRLASERGAFADVAWDLTCASSGCSALTALERAKGQVYVAALEARSEGWQPPVSRLKAPSPPRAKEANVLGTVEPLADVAAATLSDTDLVAWVTYFDPATPYAKLRQPAPDGRLEPLRASLEVRPVPRAALPPGSELPPAQTLSLRARSLGGVALAPGAPGARQALLAWAALDHGEPQVFVTLVGANGQRIRQRMLTRARGEVSDVAVTFAGDGWFIAWVDERDGDPEVYVTKVNAQLVSSAPERRLTQTPGIAQGPSLLHDGTRILVAWSDARASVDTGTGDIYLLALSAASGEPLGPATLLASTAAHSHSPKLGHLGQDAVVAWIDSQLAPAQQSEAGVRIGVLDAQGLLRRPPSLVRPPNGTVSSLAQACTADACRVAFAVDIDGYRELRGFAFDGEREPSSVRITGLTGFSGPGVSTALGDGGACLYYSDLSDGRGRVRRLLLDW